MRKQDQAPFACLQVEGKEKKRYPPLPLSTLEMHVTGIFHGVLISELTVSSSNMQSTRMRVFELSSLSSIECFVCVQVEGKEKKRYPPLPLSTLEMQKKATGIMRLGGDRIMHLAEELYQAGFISYPRTETDVFDPQMNLMVRCPHCYEGRGLESGHCQDVISQYMAHSDMHLAEELHQAGFMPHPCTDTDVCNPLDHHGGAYC